MQDSRAHGRRTLLIVAAIFLLPVAVAFTLYYGKLWRPANSASKGELIEPAHLPTLGANPVTPAPVNGLTIAPGMTVDEAEQKLIMATLDAAGGNKTRAAEMLGISLKTLHNKLNRFKEEGAKGA